MIKLWNMQEKMSWLRYLMQRHFLLDEEGLEADLVIRDNIRAL